MSLEYNFMCPLKNGIHARPANALELIATKYRSDVLLQNARNSRTANVKSVLSMISADFKLDDSCRLIVRGNDERTAYETMVTYLKDGFAHTDDELPHVEQNAGEVLIPPSLKLETGTYCAGTVVVKGLARAKAAVLNNVFNIDVPSDYLGKDKELDQFKKAVDSLRNKIADRIENKANITERKIFETHLSIASDPELMDKVSELIVGGLNAGKAIIIASDFFANTLKSAESELIQQRIFDIQDICAGLIEEIYGIVQKKNVLIEPCICVAQNLTPSQFLNLDKTFIKGLVLAYGGSTSHTIILARSFGIPTIVGVEQAHSVIRNDQEIIVDANLGVVILKQSEQVNKYYQLEQKKLNNRKNRFASFIKAEAFTSDYKRVDIGANIVSAIEAERVFNNGAQGIGLFRTEMLYMQDDSIPSENEQFEIYKKVAVAAAQRPVIIRTLDVGGDKNLACLNLESEANPFLGYRAVRIYPEFEKIIIDQFRAIIRASAFGCVKMLVPMVCSIDEIRWVKEKVKNIQKELAEQNINFDCKMPIGIMIEVPSIVFILDQLCDEADFFSIGTNDLAQYIFAVDRENKKLGKLCDTLQPAFLRVLKTIVQQIHAKGKWVGMCGEMAGQIETLPLLIGLGLDEMSLGCESIPAIKAAIHSLSYEECTLVLDSALKCTSADDVRNLLAAHQNSHNFEIIDRDMIITTSESTNKEEAIKEAVDLLYAVGRTEKPELIEREVWNREAVYSTGLGYGFAIPHCKSAYTKANSICLIKFKDKIKWNPNEDDGGVKILILLVVKQEDTAGTHMQVFSRLARKIMHSDFRDFLLSTDDSAGILKFLKESLEIK
ncbi:MAG: phosphoenolpyruvate--protein phosphotransferase [Planctomycetes bacterium GWF2_42_9]|nr:MAG: phosphoenolpyruvate--protein phosphotransferase [Planctomycetes bacterium GWF2_42_9]